MFANKDNHQAYNCELRPLANDLRHHSTSAEIHLWKHVLRAGQMMGYTFRRQRPVLSYIADFMCQPLLLIMEVDGSSHKDELIAANDTIRQAALEGAGFSVLRFTDQEVYYQTDRVRKVIEEWIEHWESVNELPARAGRMKRLRGL